MSGSSIIGRMIHSIFPSYAGKIAAAIWLPGVCHLLSVAALGAALFFPGMGTVMAVVALLSLSASLVLGLAIGHAVRDGGAAVNRDIATMFAASDTKEMRLFLSGNDTETESGKLLKKNYDTFLAGIRTLVEDLRRVGINIAVDTARLSGLISATTQQSGRQREISHEVAAASGESSSAIVEVSESAQYVAEKTASSLQMAKDSFSELMDVTGKIQQISKSVDMFRSTVEELSKSSSSILKVVSTINDIAEQTNLLSLNATIEAARAGEHGKGFAVVAEEVRELARRVKPATTEISQNINAMIAIVEKTQQGTEEIGQYTAETSQVIEDATTNFETMIQDYEENNQQLMKIASAIEEMSTTNSEVSRKVVGIDSLSQEIAGAMEKSESSVENLSNITESMLEMVSRFRTGEGVFDRLIAWATVSRDKTQQELEQLAKKGVNLWDASYKKIPHTDPQKFETSYTAVFQRSLQPMFDKMKTDMEGTIYSLAIDRKGYLPTHHTAVSQPMTGDVKRDLLYSRHMRIFNSIKAERRRCSHTQPMLLQTYMRDTGEILNDLSLPIFLDGKHWGAFIVGFDPKNFK
jgi:methyl-accepting chemotaxis protein